MALNARSITYNALLTTTADKIHKSGAIQNAITSSNPTFAAFMDKGKTGAVNQSVRGFG